MRAFIGVSVRDPMSSSISTQLPSRCWIPTEASKCQKAHATVVPVNAKVTKQTNIVNVNEIERNDWTPEYLLWPSLRLIGYRKAERVVRCPVGPWDADMPIGTENFGVAILTFMWRH